MIEYRFFVKIWDNSSVRTRKWKQRLPYSQLTYKIWKKKSVACSKKAARLIKILKLSSVLLMSWNAIWENVINPSKNLLARLLNVQKKWMNLLHIEKSWGKRVTNWRKSYWKLIENMMTAHKRRIFAQDVKARIDEYWILNELWCFHSAKYIMSNINSISLFSYQLPSGAWD